MLRPSALLPSQDGGSEYRTEYCPHLGKTALVEFKELIFGGEVGGENGRIK